MSLARATGPALPGNEEALAEARDLARVCAARDLETCELFEPNAFYGSDRVLKDYAGLPAGQPLKVVVPHGVVFDEDYVWTVERQAMLPAVLAYGEHRERAYRRATGKTVIRTAPPFAYAAKLLQDRPAPARSGTLFFPSHSTHFVTWHADFDGLAEALLALDPKFQPVTVCLYWRDYELGRHLPFTRRGLPVVSAGHIFDPQFLYRLAYLLRAHAYAASNVLGSYLPYAVMAGCRFFFIQGFEASHTLATGRSGADVSALGETGAALLREFAQPHETLGSRRAELLARACDYERVLTPGELRSAFAAAERLDRVGYRLARAGRRIVLTGRRWLSANLARNATRGRQA